MRQLRARRAGLHQRLKQARANARAKHRASPAFRKARRRRRLGLLLLLVLLLLLLRCCKPSVPEEIVQPIPDAREPEASPIAFSRPPAPRVRKKVKKRQATGQTKTQRRDAYRSEAPVPERWIGDLRLQVAARSRRLARCFEGIDRPGALRWSAAVELSSGTVSDHQLEPTLAGAVLTGSLRACLLAVLSAPTYRLSKATKEAAAPRISIVIEF